jgi:hypothetical protein
MSHRAARLARPHLLLRFAALECATQASLASCELARAQREADAAAALAARFPALLAEARGAARHLRGLCAHSCGEYAAAVAHFVAAEPVRCAGACAATDRLVGRCTLRALTLPPLPAPPLRPL